MYPAAKGRTAASLRETGARGDRADFRIVGMGGSAGGLEAFGQFFSYMPPDAGLAFILVRTSNRPIRTCWQNCSSDTPR